MSNPRRSAAQEAQKRSNPGRRLLIVLIVVVVVCLAVIGAVTAMGLGPFAQYTIAPGARIIYLSGSSSSSQVQGESSEGEAAADTLDFTFNAEALSKLPSSQALQGFSLSSLSAPALSDGQLAKLNETGGICLAEGGVSFILLNVGTGRGISYNQEQEYYSGTAFAAIYACYLCEGIFDQGRADRSEAEDLVNQAVSQASASALSQLRAKYDSYGWGDYAEALGFSGISDASNDAPSYSVRSAALQWAHIREYLGSTAENASWLSSVLSASSDSVLRLCTADATDVTVLDAYAQSTAGEGSASAINDCGYFTESGSEYLVCVMSGMAGSDENKQKLAAMLTELLALRTHLGH